VLGWDFWVIYALEREPLPAIQFGWRGHRRVHFALDSEHPIGASHHQKIVVSDDRVAFIGGVDLTFARWDTPEHLPNDARRKDANSKITRPMHDVQVAVDATTAESLGELARVRWQAATGEALSALPGEELTTSDPWPGELAPDITETEVAIARTAPAPRDQERGVREIETLTLQAIAGARRMIYIENQYLTSSAVGRALAAKLDEAEGPEVVLVLPKDQGGWLEQSSMGVLRDRLLAFVRCHDRFGRLRAYFPVISGLPEDQCLGVHSKVLIVDDDFVKVGSANLSNRSMALDTECDLAFEASGETAKERAKAIAALRARLVAEHVGVEPRTFDARLAETGSLIAAIESLDRGSRRLEPLAPGAEPAVNLAMFDGLVCDPEQPIAPERLIEAFIPPGFHQPASRSLSSYAALLVVALVVGAAWRFTPLRELLVVERLVQLGAVLRESPVAPVYVAVAYLVGGLLFFPITVLITGTTLVFDPWRGFVYSMLGTLASACMTYGLGRLVGRPVVDRLLTPRLRHFRSQLRRRSFAAILGARLVPVGNFSLINILAGALQIRFRPYFFANLLGILPGIMGFALFADRLGRTLRNPNLDNVLVLLVLFIAIVGALSLLRRALRRARRSGMTSLREVKES
jgi:phospholipase D1/2